MYYRLLLVLLLFLQTQYTAVGQNNVPTFYETIKGDSVVLFFENGSQLTERNCCHFRRFTRVDVSGDFIGAYEDVRFDNIVLSKGYHKNGKKNGYFELYHPNGKVFAKGHYVNNNPMGEWQYFYDNGVPERTVKITESDTIMVKFVDENGNLKVNNGNGTFDGFITRNSVKATGKIENGKPTGKWTSIFGGRTYCVEEFRQGKLLKGFFPNAKSSSGRKEYKDTTFLNILVPPNYLEDTENLRFRECDNNMVNKSQNTNTKPQRKNFDIAKLRSDLRSKIGRIVENDIKNDRMNDYTIGDNYLAIQFSTDEKGQAKDFLLATSWGQQFFSPISASLKSQGKFPPSVKVLFFHLKLHFPGGYSYQSSFHFSESRAYN